MIAGNDDNQLKEMTSKGAKVNAKPDLAAFRERWPEALAELVRAAAQLKMIAKLRKTKG